MTEGMPIYVHSLLDTVLVYAYLQPTYSPLLTINSDDEGNTNMIRYIYCSAYEYIYTHVIWTM